MRIFGRRFQAAIRRRSARPSLRPVSRVLAQSLIRGEAADITADVLCGNEPHLTAALLSSFRTAADGSETALMLEISYT